MDKHPSSIPQDRENVVQNDRKGNAVVHLEGKGKRQQLLNEIRTLCEAPRATGLVEFFGAFYTPDSGQISIALEYMDGGSLADIIRNKRCIPEPILSCITYKVLQGLTFLHKVRHLVHRDIKPANLLINLEGEPKITDFGISAGLDNSIAMCATFVGTVTYMSPERINNERYSFPADVWSLGLSILECATGEFPYNAAKGPVSLMLQLLEHPFVTKYKDQDIDLAAFVHSVFDPTERLKDLSEMLTTHYYTLFDGLDEMFPYMEGLYQEDSVLGMGGQLYHGSRDIFGALSELRKVLHSNQKIVHVVENMECCAYGHHGVMIRLSGTLVLGSQFVPPGSGPVGQTPPASASSQSPCTPGDDDGFETGNYTGAAHGVTAASSGAERSAMTQFVFDEVTASVVFSNWARFVVKPTTIIVNYSPCPRYIALHDIRILVQIRIFMTSVQLLSPSYIALHNIRILVQIRIFITSIQLLSPSYIAYITSESLSRYATS
ncbi:hypothetical protein CBR_g21977 [Chara braunii]|uniref:mitogen-activated protein kinase kinase n=1 Tax=Chara braunii TaxID=69332 RepID=A0A388L1R2_CHABU|nr:hypothetical protein CBR_g21977 [Chara braunii]|eukprot:GBG76229.1 hypothetical protein CBR_g21977 [Chara braunii]